MNWLDLLLDLLSNVCLIPGDDPSGPWPYEDNHDKPAS